MQGDRRRDLLYPLPLHYFLLTAVDAAGVESLIFLAAAVVSLAAFLLVQQLLLTASFSSVVHPMADM